MFAQTFRFDPGLNILVPALPDPSNLTAPCNFGPSLTIPRGASLARKTSDGKFYLFNKSASDGTQTWLGFNEVTGATDSNGIFYPVVGGSAAITYYATGLEYGTYYTSGVFDPATVTTAATGTPVAEVDTFTPATVTTGDINSVYNAAGVGVEVTIGATQTATAATTLLKNAWNADPACTALATASGTATFILTAVTPGVALGLTSTVVGTGTLTKVITTAAVSAQQAEIDTWTLTTAPSTGDTFTLTYTQPNASTITAVATVGSTQTVAAATILIAAAWNAVPALANLATATSTTTTVVLTGVNTGQVLNTVMTTSSGSTTLSKATTAAAFGRNIADLPRGYVLQPYGYWKV